MTCVRPKLQRRAETGGAVRAVWLQAKRGWGLGRSCLLASRLISHSFANPLRLTYVDDDRTRPTVKWRQLQVTVTRPHGTVLCVCVCVAFGQCDTQRHIDCLHPPRVQATRRGIKRKRLDLLLSSLHRCCICPAAISLAAATRRSEQQRFHFHHNAVRAQPLPGMRQREAQGGVHPVEPLGMVHARTRTRAHLLWLYISFALCTPKANAPSNRNPYAKPTFTSAPPDNTQSILQ